ncbi:MAG: PAS domain-containing protein [Candidatus Acidiferrales bacterium]
MFGFLAFAATRSEREWPDSLVDVLQRIAGVFDNALVRMRSAAAHLQSTERTNLAVEAAELGLWTWDVQNDRIWCSERAYTHFGQPEGTPLSFDRFLGAVHPDDRASVQRSIGAAALLPTEFKSECRIVHPDGSVKWIVCQGRSDADTSGKSAHMSGVGLDVTERKVADSQFRLVVESSPTSMVLTDDAGEIVLANAQT